MNLLAVNVDNKNPRFGERALVDYLQHSTGAVYTDPYTAYYSDSYAQWSGVDYSRIKAGPPTVGFPYFYNPQQCRLPQQVRPVGRREGYKPPVSWEVVWREREAPKALGVMLRKMEVAGSTSGRDCDEAYLSQSSSRRLPGCTHVATMTTPN